MRQREYGFREKRAFIRGILNTLNNIQPKIVILDGYVTLSSYACEVLHAKKISGVIYFDSERMKYRYKAERRKRNEKTS